MALKFQIKGKKLFVLLIIVIKGLLFASQNRGYQVNRSLF